MGGAGPMAPGQRFARGRLGGGGFGPPGTFGGGFTGRAPMQGGGLGQAAPATYPAPEQAPAAAGGDQPQTAPWFTKMGMPPGVVY
jgi:hypothetical protein